MTLADACIVLTLCRLEDVEAVYLTVDGRPRPFRDQVLTPADFLLEEGEPGEREVEAALWFPAGEELGREERTLRLAAGDRIEVALLQELLSGPESGELDRACPEGTVLRSLSLDGGRAAVNLSARFLEGEEVPLRLWAVVQTLEGVIPGVRVRFQVEGLALEEAGAQSGKRGTIKGPDRFSGLSGLCFGSQESSLGERDVDTVALCLAQLSADGF